MKTLSNKLLKIKEGLYILMHIHLSMFYQFRIAEKIHMAVSTGFVNFLSQLIDGLVYHFISHSPMNHKKSCLLIVYILHPNKIV